MTETALRVAAGQIMALDAKSPSDLGLVRQTHANGILGGIRQCACILREAIEHPGADADLVGQLCRERDDADRRAGEAQRHLASAKDSIQRRNSWLHEAKLAAGYSVTVSFDAVWAEALAALLEKRSQPPAVDEMPALDNGLNTVAGYAAEQLRGRGMVGLTHNLERLQGWMDMYVVRARAVGSGQEPTPGAQAIDALAWLAEKPSLELSYHSPYFADDDDGRSEWRVHQRSGSRNDREWDLVGRGETPLAAIQAARAATKTR